MENRNAHLFQFCPRCGGKPLLVPDEKSFLCGLCSFKFYLNTAAAGIALIFNPYHELLITKRKHDPAKGMLDLPGGFVNPGESIEDGLTREIKEELDLDVVSLTYFCSVPNTYTYKEVIYSTTDVVFSCTVNDFGTIKACDDISDFYFMEPARIDRNKFGLASPKIVIDRLLQLK